MDLVIHHCGLKVDACGPYSDLFWALRGGGGGTYGVVIRAMLQLHPNRGLTLTLALALALIRICDAGKAC